MNRLQLLVVKFNNFKMFWDIFTVQSAGDLVLDFLELDRISATFILNYLNHYESTIFQGIYTYLESTSSTSFHR